MVKNIIIAVLAIIIVAIVFFAQSQSLQALSVNEQLKKEVTQMQQIAEEQEAIAVEMTEQLVREKMVTDSLKQALNTCK